MSRAVYIFGIFAQTFYLFVLTQCQCPEYFRYFRNETTGEIMGIVEIPSPPQDVPLHLRVILSVGTVLPTKYVGRIELEKSKEESVRLLLQGLPIFYRIYFPVRNPIPVVTSITLNNILYCTGQSAMGVIVTNMILEHTLYPPRVIIPLTEQLLNYISNRTDETTSPVIPNPLPNMRTTSAVPDDMETFPTAVPNNLPLDRPSKPIDFSCGLSGYSHLAIEGGETIKPTMWPWLAAVFVIKDDFEFKCNGNLISRQFVLTVAHCLEDDGDNLPPNMLVVSLGRFNLYDWNEEGSINTDVLEYKVHPDYTNPMSADSDLAIIKLIDRIEYTPRIRPLCLWMGKPDFDIIVGKSGYVVGWQGIQQQKRAPSEPRMSKVPIVSQEDCLRSNIAFVDATSNRTFCAGRRNGSGPCIGGSGSGFVIYHTRLSRYHLRGIVSLSTIDARTRFCDYKEYVVYVDVAKYLSWIHQEMIP